MTYEYEYELLNYASDSESYEKYEDMLNEIKNVYAKQKRLMKLETLIRTSIKNMDITQMKKSGGMTQVILLKNTKNYMEDK